MSQLAYNIHGERFEPPTSMLFWRVRRLKPGGRGVPEVVFGDDGLPLLVSGEADITEFRRLVKRAPGRYRLDSVTQDQKACEDGVPAYVQVDAVTDGPPVSNSARPHHDLLRTVIAANTEMVRCMTEKFAGVMDAAAGLLRAADGAGMPQREPTVEAPSVVQVIEEPPANQSEDNENELAQILRSALDTVMPLVGHTINTKVLGLSSDQSLALLGAGNSNQDNAKPALSNEARELPPNDVEVAPEAETPATPPDFMTHLSAIESELTPKEIALVRAAVGQMSPPTLLAWRERLLSLDVKGAIGVIRAEIGKGEAS